MEAISDSTNIFYPNSTKFYIAVYKPEFKKLENNPGKFLLELRQPGNGLINRCEYKNYYNIVGAYPLPANMDVTDTVYYYRMGLISGKALHNTKTNMQGFVDDAKPGFVKDLRKNKKLFCADFENVRRQWNWNISDEQLETLYQDTFRDNFIIYLNRDKLGLNIPTGNK